MLNGAEDSGLQDSLRLLMYLRAAEISLHLHQSVEVITCKEPPLLHLFTASQEACPQSTGIISVRVLCSYKAN